MSNDKPATAKLIRIDQLVFNPDRVRHYQRMKTFEYMTILSNQVNKIRGRTVDPIHVVKRDDGKFFVVEGHLRVQATRLLWREEIKAIVADATEAGTKEMLGLLLHEVKMPITKPSKGHK